MQNNSFKIILLKTFWIFPPRCIDNLVSIVFIGGFWSSSSRVIQRKTLNPCKVAFYKQSKHCTHRQKIMKVLLQSMYHVTECQERSYNTIPVPCLIPFSWGKAISGAPSIKGTNQSPNPIIIGITKMKIMTIVGSHHFLNLVIHPTRHKGSFPPCGSIPRKRQPVLALLMLHPMSHQGLNHIVAPLVWPVCGRCSACHLPSSPLQGFGIAKPVLRCTLSSYFTSVCLLALATTEKQQQIL